MEVSLVSFSLSHIHTLSLSFPLCLSEPWLLYIDTFNAMHVLCMHLTHSLHHCQVPRKSDQFQKDIYPDTAAGKAACSAEEWVGGVTKPLVLAPIVPIEER